MAHYLLHDGERLVKAARNSIELYLGTHHFDPMVVESSIRDLKEKDGVFVILEHYPTSTPRGVSGAVKSSAPICAFLPTAAIAAATEDRGMVPVSHLEFEHLIVEVSVLSQLEPIATHAESATLRAIRSHHGLYLEYGYHTGLLLPGTPAKHGWSTEQTLDALCARAGVPAHAWRLGTAKLYTFTAQTFREKEPRGPVEETTLG